MAPFRNDPREWARADWRLLQNGWVHLFWATAVLDETIHSLTEDGYRVTVVDAAAWESKQDALVQLGNALDFPDYYGRNLDAFNDCLGDVATFQYGADESSTGTVLVITSFDTYAARQPEVAQAVMDIFARSARTGMLIGHRMLCLLQTNDPTARYEVVGAQPVLWNPREFLQSSRGL